MGVIRSGKKWGVKVYVPYSQLTAEERAKAKPGKGRQRWIGTFPTRLDAEIELDRQKRSQPRSGDETADSFALRWVADYPRERASTNQLNHGIAKRFAEDFKRRRLASITREEARQYVSARPHRRSPLRAMLEDAKDAEIVASNPFSNLRLPSSRGRKDLAPLTAQEVDALATVGFRAHESFGPQMKAMILTAAYVGCRPSELYALVPEDLDFRNSEVTIRGAITRRGGMGPTKNGESRTVICPSQAQRAIAEMPRPLRRFEFLFPSPNGGPFTTGTFGHYWRPIRTAFEQTLSDPRRRQLAASRSKGAKGIQIAELRHFCATYLLDQGVPSEHVALQLGHKDGGELIRTRYGHPDKGRIRGEILRAFEGGATVTSIGEADLSRKEAG